MGKITSILLTLATILMFTACGGGGNTDAGDITAKGILQGKDFYYTSEYLKFEDGYYKEYFDSTTLTVTEHAADGTVLDTVTTSIEYSDSNLTIDYNGLIEECSVKRNQSSVEIYCPATEYTQVLWDTIEDAKANPQP